MTQPEFVAHNTPTMPGRGLGLAPKLLGVVAPLGLLSGGLAVSAGAVLSRQVAAAGERGVVLGRMISNYLSWVRAVEFLQLELKSEERRHWEGAAADQLQRLEKAY